MSEEKYVAFCGTRGLPANYGGFETAVDEISRRFVASGRECIVFCRDSSGAERAECHEGRRLEYVEGSRKRSLDTFVSAWQTGWRLFRERERYSHVFWFNNANLPGILLTRLARIPFSVNTDGLEWRRAKWKAPFKLYYFLSSFLISRVSANLVSDSRAIRDFYKRTFFKDTYVIPYGIPDMVLVSPERRDGILARYGVSRGRYFLQITRFEPDNLPLEIARSFQSSGLAEEGFAFLVVGYKDGTPYARRIKAMSSGGGVVVADAVYDAEVLSALRAGCFCYVHGNSVGGTNPALLEAMAGCPRVLAVSGPFSREVLGETGLYFEPDDIAPALRGVVGETVNSAAMRERVESVYDWDEVAKNYIRLAEGGVPRYEPMEGGV